MTAPESVSPQMRHLVADLAQLYCAPDPSAELVILCEQMQRDHPERAIELTIDALIFTGRKTCADFAPASRVLN